jgi:hypothetical protein
MLSWLSRFPGAPRLESSIPGGMRRRDLLKFIAAFMAEHFLPRRALAREAKTYEKPSQRAIVVTFGGGARYQDTFAPSGWVNIPRLTQDLVPQGLFYPSARNEGITGHFNSSSSLITGNWQNVDSFGSEPPATPTIFEYFRKERRLPAQETWVIATNKSFSLIGGSRWRGYGNAYAANVILPKQLLLEAIQAAVSTERGPGVEDREAFAKQMLSALDEGYENYGWQVYESGHKLSFELKQTLAKSLLNYINDPSVPSSGDELTFFMAKEIMDRFAPSLMLVNFWDMDIAHYGSYSLYLQAIRRTDRLVYELWQHVQSSPQYKDRTTMIVIPEVGRDGDLHGNGFANHRSGDDSCRGVWLLALGQGVPRGTGSERLIHHVDVAPTVAQILGFKMPETQGKVLAELAI